MSVPEPQTDEKPVALITLLGVIVVMVIMLALKLIGLF